MSTAIIVFALVFLAAASVVLAWIISDQRTRMLRTESQLSGLKTIYGTLLKKVESSAPATLRADLDSLKGALDVHIASNRSEFGRLWHKQRVDQRPAVESAESDTHDDQHGLFDPHFQDMIEFQRRK